MAAESVTRKNRTGRSHAAGTVAKRPPGFPGAILLLVPALLVILVYAGTLRYPFVFDDIPNIVDNQAMRLARLDGAGLWQAAFESPHPRRPVANVSFAFNYRLHGYAVEGYHWTNVLVHVATGMIFYLLASVTLRLTRGHNVGGGATAPFDGTNVVALAAATLWMIHPCQTQSVTYIVQRMNSLAAMFYLLSMLFYVRARIVSAGWKKGAGFLAAVLSGLLAVGSKENAVTLPFFLFLYEWFFFQELDRRWLKRQWPWVAVLALVGGITLWVCLGEEPLIRILDGFRYRDFTLTERLLTQPRVVLFYLGLLAFPHPSRLNLDHHVAISRSLMTPPSTLAALLAVAGILLWAVVGARRHRLMSFALLWYLGNLAIESSVIGLELLFEHRTYLPGTFLFLALSAGVSRIRLGRQTKAMVLGVLVLCLGVWTHDRNGVWRNDLTLWQDCAAKSPQKPRPHNKLGLALERRGRLAEAERQYRRVLSLDPAHPYAYFNLANVLARQGRTAEAADNYLKALELVPDNAGAHINLGMILARTGRHEDALSHFLRVGPEHGTDYVLAQRNAGLLFMEMGQYPAAMSRFQAALAMAPGDWELLYSMGNAFLGAGELDEAVKWYDTALEIAPGNPEIHNNLGMVLMQKRLFAEAISHFERATSLQPRNPDFRRNLKIAKGNTFITPD